MQSEHFGAVGIGAQSSGTPEALSWTLVGVLWHFQHLRCDAERRWAAFLALAV